MKLKDILLVMLLFFGVNTFAQQLTYKPVNPAAGGDPFAYQQMLTSATAQNNFEDKSKSSGYKEKSAMEQFAERFNTQLISQLTRTMFDSQFGEGFQAGNYVLGDMSIEIYESSQGMVINMLNTQTGEYTQIIMPLK